MAYLQFHLLHHFHENNLFLQSYLHHPAAKQVCLFNILYAFLIPQSVWPFRAHLSSWHTFLHLIFCTQRECIVADFVDSLSILAAGTVPNFTLKLLGRSSGALIKSNLTEYLAAAVLLLWKTRVKQSQLCIFNDWCHTFWTWAWILTCSASVKITTVPCVFVPGRGSASWSASLYADNCIDNFGLRKNSWICVEYKYFKSLMAVRICLKEDSTNVYRA